MAARKKASTRKPTGKKGPARKKAPARGKTPARNSTARGKSVRVKAPTERPVPRELPSNEAWRELIETAVENPDPVRGAPRKAARK